MSAINWIKMVATKSLTGSRGSGIRSIPSAIEAEAKTGELLAILQQAGLPINQLDDYIRSEADVLKFINIIKNANKPRVISGTSAEGKAITEKLFGKKGEVVEFPQKRSFKEQIDAMRKSGDIVDADDVKISEKITDREMFKNSKLNKPTVEGQMEKINKASNRIDEIKKEQAAMYKPKVDTVEETVTYIKTLEPITAMKEANLVIGRKGKYKDLTPEQSKKILQDTEDHIFERDIPDEDFAKGGRAGFYTGGITDVEPSLDDIGHGSDSLMARTRLLSPNNQATTSTGLNYLLAEDNDNIRVPFKGGGLTPEDYLKVKDMLNHWHDYKKSGGTLSKTNFGIAFFRENNAEGGRIGYKDGLGPSDQPMGPVYTTNKIEDAAKEVVKRLIKLDGVDIPLTDKISMSLGPDLNKTEISGVIDILGGELNFGGGIKGNNKGIGFNFKKSFADGGPARQNFKMGKRAFLKLMGGVGAGIAGLKSGILGLGGKGVGKKAVTETVKSAGSGTPPPYFFKLLEKIKTLGDDAPRLTTQDRQKVTTYKDYTLTEDVTTGEKTIQRMKMDDDLKYDASEYYGKPLGEETYMNYKPGKGQADETMKGKTPPDEYTEDTSLIRSDKPAEGEVIDTFDGVPDDVLEEVGETIVKKADGGRIGFSGGGIFRAIIAKSAAAKGLKPYEFIKVTSYKSLPQEVKMFLSADDFAKLKSGQQDMYTNYIDMAKTRKNFQEQIEGGKNTPARELFEGMEKTMDQQSFVPKTVTSDDIAEMELMVKNRFNKGRKDNAQGGLQTMLGE
jgi:hypothetical protein